MKKVLIFLILSMCVFMAFTDVDEAFLKKYNLSEMYNEVDKITWFTSFRYDPAYLYFGKSAETGEMVLRIKLIYIGNKRLKIDKCVFLIDGDTWDFVPTERPEIKTSPGNSKVEIIDTRITPTLLPLMKKIAKSKKTEITFIGKKGKAKRKLKKKQIGAFQNILDAYFELFFKELKEKELKN